MPFRNRLYLGIFSIIFYTISFFSLASAQGLPNSIASLEISSSVASPIPGQKVTITARSYSFNINAANITWSIDGKNIQSGNGLTIFTLNAPEFGKRVTIKVTAVTNDNQQYTANFVLNSGSIDLITETDGYKPPFFKGKLSPVYQNSVKIIAIPHIADLGGKEYDPKTLIYEWRKNEKVLEDQSGYGKQEIILEGDIVPRPYLLAVTVTNKKGDTNATGYINISANAPSVGFYMVDPLYGPLFNKQLGSKISIGNQKETGILAVPFGFNLNQNSLIYSWLVNGTEKPELSSIDSIVLRAPEGLSGSSDIDLDIKNDDKILQGAAASFKSIFNSKKEESDSSALFN